MTDAQEDKWDARYRDADGPGAAAPVLMDNVHLLPAHGAALDLACGLGANALLLAESGLQAHAWDRSAVALGKLDGYARRRRLSVCTLQRDVQRQPPAPESFDVIVVVRFLERTLAPALIAALRPGGLLFYQTFTRERVDDSGPDNPCYRLANNELLDLFAPLRVLFYREEGGIGDTARGFRNQALLVAGK